MNTVLITGCSSGFGLATAKYFLERDWRVIATMRKPDEDIAPHSTHLQIVDLEVSDASAIAAAISTAGPISVVRHLFALSESVQSARDLQPPPRER
jgi:NADP-dependent 3-hydroxy acid dehydrogenase YdfG